MIDDLTKTSPIISSLVPGRVYHVHDHILIDNEAPFDCLLFLGHVKVKDSPKLLWYRIYNSMNAGGAIGFIKHSLRCPYDTMSVYMLTDNPSLVTSYYIDSDSQLPKNCINKIRELATKSMRVFYKVHMYSTAISKPVIDRMEDYCFMVEPKAPSIHYVVEFDPDYQALLMLSGDNND